MTPGSVKRTYRTVAVVERDGGFNVALDGKLVSTPKRQPMVVPTQSLAEAIAEEWRGQGNLIDPTSMPLTRLASSAIDIVSPSRAVVIEQTVAYASTDLLCYRAEGPPSLVERQNAHWQPILDWVALNFDAALKVTAGVMATEQPSSALGALTRIVEAHDDRHLTALSAATAACGSLLLALALAKGRIDAETAAELSMLDEIYQIEQWGDDPEAAKRRANLKAEIMAAARFLALLEG